VNDWKKKKKTEHIEE